MNSARLRLAARPLRGWSLRGPAFARLRLAARPLRGLAFAGPAGLRYGEARQGASLTPEFRTLGLAAPRCWAARRGGIGDHPEPRDRMRGLGLARCSPRRDGGNQCNIINLRRVRWRRSDASPNRRLTKGVARNARFPAPPPRERGCRSRIRASCPLPGVFLPACESPPDPPRARDGRHRADRASGRSSQSEVISIRRRARAAPPPHRLGGSAAIHSPCGAAGSSRAR